MLIPCYRCEKQIDTPRAGNAFYVISSDALVDMEVDVCVAVCHSKEALDAAKAIEEDGDIAEETKASSIEAELEKYEKSGIEVKDNAEALNVAGYIRTEIRREARPVQKTAIVCLDCKKDDDQVIWGRREIEERSN